MKHVEAHTQTIQAIPAEKRKQKLGKTIAGVMVAGTGFALPVIVPAFPVWFAMGVVGFGGFLASGELLKKYLGYVPAVIRDVMGAVRGKNGK